jgi:hypothetical protein
MSLHKGKDFSRDGRICLSKALLSAVDESLSGYQVYAKYFNPYTLVNADTNISCIKRRSKMLYHVRATMYGRRPSKEPAFFDINVAGDVNRLSTMLDSLIVIYYARDENDLSRLEVFHDFRVQQAVQGWQQYETSAKNKKTISLVVTSKGSLYRIEPLLVPAKCLDLCVNRLSFHLKESEWLHDSATHSLTYAIAKVLQLPETPKELVCSNYLELQSKGLELFRFWKRPILLVGYCKNRISRCPKNRLKKRSKFSNCTYVTLAFIGPNEMASTVVSEENSEILCLHADSRIGILCADHRTQLIKTFKNNSPRDSIGTDAKYQEIPAVSLDQARDALARKQQKMKEAKIKKDLKANPDRFPRALPKEISKLCKCDICISSQYDDNMSKSGPERLCTVQLDVTDLLQMLGAATSENLQIVERLCELSIAAMDVESMTVTVHTEKPESVLAYAAIDDVSLGGYVKKIQKPIMIAHLDSLLLEKSNTAEICDETKNDLNIDLLTFTAESDSEEDIYKMMEYYWKAVLICRNKVIEEKRKIAQPLFDLIRQYDAAHIEFFKYWQLSRTAKEDLRAVGDVWFQSIPGKLQKALASLIAQYEIFSFYG